MLRWSMLASRLAADWPWRRSVCGAAPLLASNKFKGEKKKSQRPPGKAKADKKEVEIRRTMTVEALARAMDKDADDVLEALVNTGLDMSTLHERSVLEERWIKEAVTRSGMKFRWEKLSEPPLPRPNRDAVPGPPAPADRLAPRPPVVTVMGHVDHGKTTLLDALRKSQVAASEAGGITQHIGAFRVDLPTGERMTFLDTPGHAAFSAMRARGAVATDIVVLVVAADDGVMAQTVESVQHAKQAGVPIIVALNKCDKAGADPERVKRELLAHDVVCEDLGGDVQAVDVSALTGLNLPALAEAVAALAEMLELGAPLDGPAEGLVIESRTDRGKGPVTTALIQRGSLRRGRLLVAGQTWAKVRSLTDERGRSLDEVRPGEAAEVCGWREAPSAGDVVLEVESEQRAREVSEWRCHQEAEERLAAEESAVSAERQRHRDAYGEERASLAHLSWRQRRSLLYRRDKKAFARRPSEKNTASEDPRLALVVKADVDGSLEAIMNILETYDAHDQCQLDVVHVGVGDISENDVSMAQAFGGKYRLHRRRGCHPFDVAAFGRRRVRLQRVGEQGGPAGGGAPRRPRQDARRHLQDDRRAEGRHRRSAAAAGDARGPGRGGRAGRLRRDHGGQEEDGGGRLPCAQGPAGAQDEVPPSARRRRAVGRWTAGAQASQGRRGHHRIGLRVRTLGRRGRGLSAWRRRPVLP
ncbi:translation initiation factor IF-2, mitochondrial isoform X1 [Stigmatopora argus]